MFKIPNIWADGRCFIVGGGPSLLEQLGVPTELRNLVASGNADVSMLADYFDPIKQESLIGVNMAYKLGNWLDVIFFGDKNFWGKNAKQLVMYPGLVLTCADLGQYKPRKIKHVKKNSNHFYGISTNPAMVSWNSNSGAAAINVAFHLGAKQIILLGFDMDSSPKQEHHWHKLYGERTMEVQKKAYKVHLRSFDAVSQDAKALGLEILNASPTSVISQFKKVKLEDVI